MRVQKKQATLAVFLSAIFLILSAYPPLTPTAAQEEEEQTYFSLTFLVDTESQDLMQVAQIIEGEMWKIGIDARLSIQQNIRDRVFLNIGHQSYEEGGFDVGFYGWYDGLSAPSTLQQFFHSESISYTFGNFFPANDRLLDTRLNLLGTTTDFTTRAQLVELILDQVIWEIHPMTSIYQEEEFFAVDSALSGFDPVQMRIEKAEFLDDQTVLAFVGLSSPNNYNPFLAGSYYDSLISQQLFDGLLGADADYNYDPMIAKEPPESISGYNQVARRNVDEGEGLLWEVKIRSDVYWHDGYGYTNETVGVDDILFTYRTSLNSQIRTPFFSLFQQVFGSNPYLAIEEIDNETVRFHLAESVREISTLFTRKPRPAGWRTFFSDRFLDLPSVFSLPILPRHILDPQYDSSGEGLGLGGAGRTADGAEIPGYNEWQYFSDFNSGSRSGNYSGRAIIGNGPYQLETINETGQYVETSAFPKYYKTVVDGEYSSKPQAFRLNFGLDKYRAETALVTGEVDILDSNLETADDLIFLQSYPAVQLQKKRGWQMYGIGYNTFNPYLADPNVRLAISHLIPRQEIADYVFGGTVRPSFAPLPEQSPYWSERIPRVTYNLTKAWDFMEKAGYDMSELRSRLKGEGADQTSGSVLPLTVVLFSILGIAAIKRKRRSNI